MPSLRILRAAGVLTFAFLCQPAIAHDFWINHGRFKAPTGEHCCGPGDCKMIEATEVSVTGSGYLLSTGEMVPFTEAQGSEDGEFWRCKRHDGSRRCFFAPQPSS